MGKEPEETARLTVALVSVAVTALVVALVISLVAETKPTPDAMLALVTSVVGVVGTHIGHVTGHRLGKGRSFSPGQGPSESKDT